MNKYLKVYYDVIRRAFGRGLNTTSPNQNGFTRNEFNEFDDIFENIHILSQLQGFSLSKKQGRPVTADGAPIPWYTYPAIEFFSQFDISNLFIFEYGCGNSSLFWARKRARLWAVEHDPKWHEVVKAHSSEFEGLLLRETKESYMVAIKEPGVLFDIVVIDGIWRNECARETLNCLKPNGIIILDNSDWYTDVSTLLRNQGFFQIDFNGFGPINPYCWTTSLFLPWQSSFQNRINLPHPIGGITTERGELW
jgi:hypothetical protein